MTEWESLLTGHHDLIVTYVEIQVIPISTYQLGIYQVKMEGV